MDAIYFSKSYEHKGETYVYKVCVSAVSDRPKIFMLFMQFLTAIKYFEI